MQENIIWHSTSVTRQDREQLLGHKGKVVWLTGLSGSGKSTLANAVGKELHKTGKLTYLLDGDNLRHGLNKDLGFTLEDRKENIRRIAEATKLFLDAGLVVLAAFISPFREDRQSVRELLQDDFIEVYVSCSLEECEMRDPKNLYKKARLGEIKEFTGINSPYEAPLNPELTVNTDEESLDACVNRVLTYINKQIEL